MTTVSLLAFAKLNLYLAVLSRRADGYHEIESWVQTVDLADRIEMSVGEGEGIAVRNSLRGIQGPDLAERAAAALLAAKGTERRVEIRIAKHIPAGAGLGGGSSDAAAVLQTLDRLIPPPLPAAELMSIAAAIGSDVPLFLVGGCLHVAGRGEIVARLADSRREHYVVVAPAVHCPTADVYAAWAAHHSRPGGATLGRNDLQASALLLRPELKEVAAAIARSGALYGGMSGSGSAFYAAYGDREGASDAARRLHVELPSCAVHVCRATAVGSLELEGGWG